jgi:putative aminopeptidase FrvX
MSCRELSQKIEKAAQEFNMGHHNTRKMVIKPDLNDQLKEVCKKHQVPLKVMKKIVFYEFN